MINKAVEGHYGEQVFTCVCVCNVSTDTKEVNKANLLTINQVYT